MKTFIIALIFFAQLSMSVWLVTQEDWASGIIFFLVSSIFIGIMARLAELINQLWARIFDKN